MRFQERDGHILTAIYNYDGVLARRHIKEMFWPHASTRAMAYRLAALRQEGYIVWPDLQQRKTRPIPESICWLGWQGILWVAGRAGVTVKQPASDSQNQMRQLARRLRGQGVRWLREPNWNQLSHDLGVVGFRMAVEKAAYNHPSLTLEQWIPESVFRSDTDVVEYKVGGQHKKTRQRRKGVVPDGYFVIADEERRRRKELYRARFLLELDMATEDNPRFGSDKVQPGVAYLHSNAYEQRFGVKSGRWLVVTTGQLRMENMMRMAHRVAGENATRFLFTTQDVALPANLLTGPIWHRVDWSQPGSLFAE